MEPPGRSGGAAGGQRPKIAEALTVWREFPRHLASDLRRFFGAHIRDWHQGRMPSRELLELFGASATVDAERRELTIQVEFAPEDGAVAKELRRGGWTVAETLAAETFNELARLRASFHASKKAPYEPFQFEDPATRAAKAEATDEAMKLQAEVEDDIF